MKRTYKLFRLFLPIILALTVVSSIVGVFIFTLTFNPTSGINFLQAAPIVTLLLIGISVVVSFCFVFKIKHTYVTKYRKDSNVLKFSSVFAFVVVFALTVFDFYVLINSGTVVNPAKVFKVLRIIAAIPFLIYIVIYALPKRMFRQKVVIPNSLQSIASIGTITWALFSILAIWFFESPAHIFFKVEHTLFYALFTLYIVTEIKAQLVKPSVKLHIITALLLFTIAFPFAIAIIIGNINDISVTRISLFEYLAAIALPIYALSKVYAYQYTIKFVMDTERTSTRTHHHHSHHTNSIKENDEGVNEEVISEDVATEEASPIKENEAQNVKIQNVTPFQKTKSYPKSKSSKKKKKK